MATSMAMAGHPADGFGQAATVQRVEVGSFCPRSASRPLLLTAVPIGEACYTPYANLCRSIVRA